MVAVVAVLGRVAFAVVSFIYHSRGLAPDEQQYIGLARSVAEGAGAEAWQPGYGQALYDTTWAFSAPLAFLFDVLTPTRLVGQLWAVVFGVATAVATAVLAERIAGRRAAVLAGMAVALFPSQILWSSVVLRESMIWLALASIALGVARSLASRIRLSDVILVVAGCLVLGFLRQQTMLVAVWSVFLVALLLPRPGRIRRAAGALVIAVAIPFVAGHGPGGLDLIENASKLALKRAQLSEGADSAFTDTTAVSPSSDERDDPAGHPGDDTVYDVEDEGLEANLRALPRGAVATTLRPFIWEDPSSTALRLAGIENLAWYVFYLLALLGCWHARTHVDEIAFPVMCTAGLLFVASVTQGNLGTAFRHRGQIFWALAVLSAVAATELLARRRAAVVAEVDDRTSFEANPRSPSARAPMIGPAAMRVGVDGCWSSLDGSQRG